MILCTFVLSVFVLCTFASCGGEEKQGRQLAMDALAYIDVEIVTKSDPLVSDARVQEMNDVAVTIKVTNHSQLHLRYINGVITFYDAEGNLIGRQKCQFSGGYSQMSSTERTVKLADMSVHAQEQVYYTSITELSATFSVEEYCFDVGTTPYQLGGDIAPLAILTPLPEGQGINQTQRTYREGLRAFAQKAYQLALDLFQSIHPYEDTDVYMQRCQGYIYYPKEQEAYDHAMALLKQEKYTEAFVILQGIIDYKDAKDQIDTLKTSAEQKAEEMAGKGEYSEACSLLTSLGYDPHMGLSQAYTLAAQGEWMQAIEAGLTVVVLPEGTESLPNGFLTGQSSVTKVVLPSTVTHIGNNAFKDCTSLANVNFPTSLVAIGESAFEGCVSLTVFNTNATPECLYIGKRAFYGCTSLTTIEFAPYDAQRSPYSIDVGTYAFAECSSLSLAYMPGKMTTVSEGVFQNCVKLDAYQIGEDVTSIDKGAFKGCVALTDMVLPERLSVLQDEAFEGCTSLKNMVIPQNVTSIGAGCFAGCTELTSVSMFNGVKGWTTSRIQEGVYFDVNDAAENAELLTSVSGYNNAIWTKWVE